MLPSEFPEISSPAYASLRRLCSKHLDMQFEDVRVMLRLPKAAFPAGCNLATASVLFNLIAGLSVCVYKANPSVIQNHPPAGANFRNMLEQHFPWQGDPVPGADAARVLWKYSRNPLAHALGLDRTTAPTMFIGKKPLSDRRIRDLEDAPSRPAWARAAVRRQGTDYRVSVLGLYWGTHRMLHSLFADPTHAGGAEALARSLNF